MQRSKGQSPMTWSNGISLMTMSKGLSQMIFDICQRLRSNCLLLFKRSKGLSFVIVYVIHSESHIQFICDKQGPSKDCNVTIGYLTKLFIYVQIQDKNI